MRTMRTLPKQISWTRDGYLIRVVRGKVRYQAFVSHRHADALARAVAVRDRFWRLVGEVANLHKIASTRSNTGIAGISETVVWRHRKRYDCFCVSWSDQGRHRTWRSYFGAFRPRSEALRRAIEYRQRVARVTIPTVPTPTPMHTHDSRLPQN